MLSPCGLSCSTQGVLFYYSDPQMVDVIRFVVIFVNCFDSYNFCSHVDLQYSSFLHINYEDI